jgi:hypothetical protein
VHAALDFSDVWPCLKGYRDGGVTLVAALTLV